jgi:hypothetical protein
LWRKLCRCAFVEIITNDDETLNLMNSTVI